MSRIRCYRPRSCGVSFHVAGTTSAKKCQEAVKALPRRSGPTVILTDPPKPQTSVTDSDGNLILESGPIPPVPGSKAIVRNRNTGETMELEFHEGTRRIQTSSVFRWKFHRKDDPDNAKTMLWDASNPESSPYEIVEYV